MHEDEFFHSLAQDSSVTTAHNNTNMEKQALLFPNFHNYIHISSVIKNSNTTYSLTKAKVMNKILI